MERPRERPGSPPICPAGGKMCIRDRDVSGGGKVIADAVLNLFGGSESASTMALMAAGVIVTGVLTNFMSNTALAAMMTPIYIEIAKSRCV